MDRKVDTQLDLLINIMQMVVRSKVCPGNTVQEWAKIILQAHSKGYLYVMFKDGVVQSVACAYRVPEWNQKYESEMPVEESGDVLYVAWAASESEHPLTLTRMLKQYLNQNKNIKEIVYYKGCNTEILKRFKVKGIQNGK